MGPQPTENRPPERLVRVRFWAAARAAAGVEETTVTAASVGEARSELVHAMPALEPLLPLCSILVDGVRADPGRALHEGSVVEVLPPFAGG